MANKQKAWRRAARARNELRAAVIALNSGLPLREQIPVPLTARAQARHDTGLQRVLDKGPRSNWLLAGLINRLDWVAIVMTLARYDNLSARQRQRLSVATHPSYAL